MLHMRNTDEKLLDNFVFFLDKGFISLWIVLSLPHVNTVTGVVLFVSPMASSSAVEALQA